jgi:hypothetical protein
VARQEFYASATRLSSGVALAAGVTYVVYSDSAGTVLADIAATSGGASIPGSSVTTTSGGVLNFWGPTDGTNTLYLRCPAQGTFGVQRIDALADPRLDTVEGRIVDPEDYGADGTGAANSATALAAAISAAQTLKRPLVSKPGKTYRTDSTLPISATMVMDLQGSVIKKGAALNGKALAVTGDDVTLRNVVVDGNRAGGALGGGISWDAASGKAFDCTVAHTKEDGWVAFGAGTTLDTVRCVSTDNVTAVTGQGAGKGFVANTGAVLRLEDFRADDNDYVGVFLDPTAGVGCRLNGQASRNAHAGVRVENDGGTIPYLYAEGNNRYALILTNNASDWMCGTIKVRDGGAAIPAFNLIAEGSGAAVQFFGTVDCTVDTIDVQTSESYAFAVSDFSSAGGTNNRIGQILAVGINDPAVLFSTNAALNHIGTVIARACTFAVNYGEGSGPAEYNTIGTVIADGCTYGAIKIDDGNHNHIGRVIARNITNADTTNIAKGVIQVGGVHVGAGSVADNSIGWLDYEHDTAVEPTKPIHLVHVNAGSTGNRISGRMNHAAVQTSVALDLNGTNRLAFQADSRYVTARRSSGNLALNNTSWTDVDTGIDLVLPAATGDVIEVSLNGLIGNEGVNANLDVATIVSAAPVTYFSSATGTPSGDGVAGWFAVAGQYFLLGVPVALKLVTGDVSAGTVTLRLRFKTAAASNKTLFAGATQFVWSAKNLGRIGV